MSKRKDQGLSRLKQRFLVGIDDTDSSKGLCTTYLAYRVACDLRDVLTVLPYPRLVRLNPNIPFKTRGNAAVCLEVIAPDPGRAFERLSAKVRELSDEENGANSGLVLVRADSPLEPFSELYDIAVRGVVNVHRVKRLLAGAGAMTATLGNGMGLVGAAAAIGFSLESDHTFELIAYRRPESWGMPRLIDPSSVRKMERSTFPQTFNSYDYQKRRVLVAPHGPDPVFAGVRGESPDVVAHAFSSLEFEEPLDGYMVYVTNQHTDAHVRDELDWKAFSSGWAEGIVVNVRTGTGGHVYVDLDSGHVRRVAAFYEPTGDLRRAALLLRPGDVIKVSGGVRRQTTVHPRALNAEKLEVLRLSGRGRMLARGTYVSSPRSNRHLTKPLARAGHETRGTLGTAETQWLREFRTRRLVPAQSQR